MLDPAQCKIRQRRLLELMQRRRLDAVALGSREDVYYFTSHLADWKHQAACIVFADGRSWLSSANRAADGAAADDAVAYEANWFGTLRMEQAGAVTELIRKRLGAARRRVGVDASAITSLLAHDAQIQLEFVDEHLFQMRRIKDPDELELMKHAIRCCQAMYQRARQIIEPGVSELRVFGELHTAAVEIAGEPLSALLGNDFGCGARGGPARAGHVAHAGEIYIIDVGPAYRGYFADNARAFAVDRKPTDAQLGAWNAIMACHQIVQGLAKPGARCRDIFSAVDEHLRQTIGRGLAHHLGHGVGLYPHEYPHLNPKWDDVLQEGEILAVEPGLYGREIGGGIRIENQYLVSKSAVVNLTDFPTELA